MMNNNPTKKIFPMLLMILSVAGIIYCFLALFNFAPSFGFSKTFLTIGIISFILLFFLFGSIYRKSKENSNYNEFGVRKKLQMSRLPMNIRKKIEAENYAAFERILPKERLQSCIHDGSWDPEGDLETLIGLKEVKDTFNVMISRIHLDKNNKDSSRHAVFYGEPGTGKTTVARIYAGFLYKYGYIDENKVVEISGADLLSNNSANTNTKTLAFLKASRNGILFIDEAYALTEGLYGDTALAALIKDMEDNRDTTTIIFAGYTNKMKNFLNKNPGIRSRIGRYIEFPSYSNFELFKIAEIFAYKTGYTLLPECLEQFTVRVQAERALPTFGAARTVRKLIEEIKDNHAVNFQNNLISKKDKFILSPIDINVTPPKTI